MYVPDLKQRLEAIWRSLDALKFVDSIRDFKATDLYKYENKFTARLLRAIHEAYKCAKRKENRR